MLRWIIGFALCASILSASAQTEDKKPLPFPIIDDFLGYADFWGAELSPQGRYVAGMRHTEYGPVTLTVDLEATENKSDYIDLRPFVPIWLNWATEDRLVMKVRGYIDYGVSAKKFLSMKDIKDKNYKNFPYPIDRLVAVDRNGKNTMVLLSDRRDFQRSFSNANVVSFLRNDPDHIMMAAHLRGDLDLFKVNVKTGDYERVAEGTQYTYNWYVDRSGEPAFRFNTNSRGTVIYIYAREEKKNGKLKWKKVRTIRVNRDDGNRETATEFDPLFPGPTETTYYVAARPEGEKTTGIYLYDFSKDEFIETIKKDPVFDVDRAFFNLDTGEFMGTGYFQNRLTLEFKDPTIQANLNGLQEYFGENISIVPVQSARNGRVWLLKTFGPTDPGSYHSFDLDKAFVDMIGYNFFKLQDKALSDTQVIEYKARDGVPITGYLTRPADAKPGDKPPLIVMPHGGPEARDYLNFDFDVQMLTAYGYQVFQPNFRGSSGFGKDFADMGRRQWGKAMQTDVDDGFQELVSRGFADPEKACIYGASYGGFAALFALTKTPDLYKCHISDAGVSDLLKMLAWERKEEGWNSEAYTYWVEHIGDPKDDKAEIAAVSPVNNVSTAKGPLLLIHGENDNVVPIEQSEFMEKAMKDAGKSVSFLRLKNSGHSSYGDGDEKRFRLELLAFLREHLPTPRNQPVKDTKDAEKSEALDEKPKSE